METANLANLTIASINSALLRRQYQEANELAIAYLRERSPLPKSILSAIKAAEQASALYLSEESNKGFDAYTYGLALESLKGNVAQHCSKVVRLASQYVRLHFQSYVAGMIANHIEARPAYEPYLTYHSSLKLTIGDQKVFLPQISDPIISIILPVYKVETAFLSSTILSVIRQTFSKWELCIYFSDLENEANRIILECFAKLDPRIILKIGHANHGISGNSNICLEMARGDYIALLDHDDDLTTDALQKCVEIIRVHPDAVFIYTDKDSMLEDGKTLVNPLLKPDWSPETLYSANYLTHFNVIRRSAVVAVGGFDPSTDGAQDWDLFLKVTEKTNSIYSAKNICYHWRIHANSTSTGLEAKPYAHQGQINAIQNHLNRTVVAGTTVQPNQHGGFQVTFDREILNTKTINCLLYGDAQNCEILASQLSADRKSGIPLIISIAHVGSESSIASHVLELNEVGNNKRCDTIVIINSAISGVSIERIQEVSQWPLMHPDIAFCAGILIDSNSYISEAGLAYDSENKKYFSPFQGCKVTDYGVFGSPLWYRNYQSADYGFVAIDSNSIEKLIESGLDIPGLLASEKPLAELLRAICGLGYRGMVNPHSILQIKSNDRQSNVVAEFLHAGSFSSENCDPYFHPALTASPPSLKEIVKPSFDDKHITDIRLSLPAPLQGYFFDAISLAHAIDITPQQITANKQRPELLDPNINQRTAVWFLPDFNSAFYGGVMTILRLAEHMSTNDGIHNTFAICGDVDLSQKQDQVLAAFPNLINSGFIKLSGPDFMNSIPVSDYGIATLWTTAYILAATERCHCKYYMIQDYEPFFYPAGSTFAQAELSYKFGFYGIANTESLARIYEQDYGGKAICLTPAVDTSIFYPTTNLKKIIPMKIFYYARPNTPRNCFELASAAFKLLKNKYGDLIEIVCAGAGWNPSIYDLDKSVTMLGMLPYEQTADLYRSCHLGISMMMTKHPSYLPLEMMACGTIVLANDNEANKWLLKDNINCLLFLPTRSCLFERVSYAIDNYDYLNHIKENAISTIADHHSSWGNAMRSASAFIHSAGLNVNDSGS
jgi:glycosyltransferase involved in cell wall biosynthesis